MAAAPCKECGRRPKLSGRHRCLTCQLRHAPIGEQVAAARARLAMVPPELRVKRTKMVQAQAPAGTAFCAGCQSFRDVEDFGSGATQCRACASATQHGAMIERTYGLTATEYDRLLAEQGGRCAICRARPKSKRLAVDHDHKTGAVRGLLCSRCNHDLLGSAWDSLAMATALWHYMNTPPALGGWQAPGVAPQLAPVQTASGATSAPKPPLDLVTKPSASSAPRCAQRGAAANAEPPVCEREHYLPTGSQQVAGKRGVWRVWVAAEGDGDAPF